MRRYKEIRRVKERKAKTAQGREILVKLIYEDKKLVAYGVYYGGTIIYAKHDYNGLRVEMEDILEEADREIDVFKLRELEDMIRENLI